MSSALRCLERPLVWHSAECPIEWNRTCTKVVFARSSRLGCVRQNAGITALWRVQLQVFRRILVLLLGSLLLAGCTDDGAVGNGRTGTADQQGAEPPSHIDAGPFPVDDEGVADTSPFPVSGDSFWPQFHGPDRDNISDEAGLLKTWPEAGPRLLWKAEGLGEGFATVSLAHDLIYTTGNVKEKTVLRALDLNRNVVWSVVVGGAWDKEHPGTRGNPTIDEDRLYYESPLGDVVCLEAKTGGEVWRWNILEKFGGENLRWALCESLLIDGDHVICCPGGQQTAMVALNKYDGNTVWQSPSVGELAGYASPSLGEHDGLCMIFTTTAKSIIAVNADNGELLWKFRHVTPFDENVMMPVYHDGHVFVSTQVTGGVMLRIDVDGDQASVHEVWRTKELDNHHGGVLLHDGHLYGTGSSGVRHLQCLRWKDGEQVFQEQSVAKGSLTYADGMLYCLDEKGTVSLVKADPGDHGVVGRFKIPAGGNGYSWAHAVVCAGRLYIRHGDYLYVYDVCAEQGS